MEALYKEDTLLQEITYITDNVQKYLVHFHNYLSIHAEEIKRSDYDADLIGFLFEEKNEILTEKIICSIEDIKRHLGIYFNHIQDELNKKEYQDKSIAISDRLLKLCQSYEFFCNEKINAPDFDEEMKKIDVREIWKEKMKEIEFSHKKDKPLYVLYPDINPSIAWTISTVNGKLKLFCDQSKNSSHPYIALTFYINALAITSLAILCMKSIQIN